MGGENHVLGPIVCPPKVVKVVPQWKKQICQHEKRNNPFWCQVGDGHLVSWNEMGLTFDLFDSKQKHSPLTHRPCVNLYGSEWSNKAFLAFMIDFQLLIEAVMLGNLSFFRDKKAPHQIILLKPLKCIPSSIPWVCGHKKALHSCPEKYCLSLCLKLAWQNQITPKFFHSKPVDRIIEQANASPEITQGCCNFYFLCGLSTFIILTNDHHSS